MVDASIQRSALERLAHLDGLGDLGVYATMMPPAATPSPSVRHDAPRLREVEHDPVEARGVVDALVAVAQLDACSARAPRRRGTLRRWPWRGSAKSSRSS